MKYTSFNKIENEELFDLLSKTEQQAELIRLGIYKLDANTEVDTEFLDFNLINFTRSTDKVNIGDVIQYNQEYYYINPEIYVAIYYKAGFIVHIHEELTSDILDRQIEHIKTLIPKKTELLEFLINRRNEYLKKYLNLMHNYPNFLDGLKNPQDYGFESIDHLITASIKESNEILHDFVFNKLLEDNTLTKVWIEAATLELRIIIINERIDELNNFVPYKQKNPPKPIFKDDGEKIFDFITNESVEEKNTAFFSYLYLFLRSQNKTYSKTYQNEAYRNYVLNRSLIPNGRFRSIQKTTDTEETKFYNIVSQFKTDMKKYYSANERVKKE